MDFSDVDSPHSIRSDGNQGDSDEYLYVEENGDSKFKRLSSPCAEFSSTSPRSNESSETLNCLEIQSVPKDDSFPVSAPGHCSSALPDGDPVISLSPQFETLTNTSIHEFRQLASSTCVDHLPPKPHFSKLEIDIVLDQLSTVQRQIAANRLLQQVVSYSVSLKFLRKRNLVDESKWEKNYS